MTTQRAPATDFELSGEGLVELPIEGQAAWMLAMHGETFNVHHANARDYSLDSQEQKESGAEHFWSRDVLLTRATTLLVFAGIWAAMKGVADIVRAFAIRRLGS